VKHLAVTWVGLRADGRGELDDVVMLVGRTWCNWGLGVGFSCRFACFMTLLS
jgi:hypothetical protein